MSTAPLITFVPTNRPVIYTLAPLAVIAASAQFSVEGVKDIRVDRPSLLSTDERSHVVVDALDVSLARVLTQFGGR